MANISGTPNDDDLKGDRNLVGPRENDTINGLGGNDTINSGLGRDNVDGGAGNDLLIVDYSSNPYTGTTPKAGISSSIFRNSAGSYNGNYTAFYDTSFNSDITFFSNIERFQITGTGADDSIITGDGDDIINGGAGNDALNAGLGNNTINGGAGDDVIDGGAGINIIDGGTGTDTLINGNFGAATADLSFNDTVGSSINLANVPTISNIERFQNLTTGSGADVISFTERFDNGIMATGSGDDTINSGLGRDSVDGGAGNDLLIVDYSSNPYAGTTPKAGISSNISSNGAGGYNGNYTAFYDSSSNSDAVSFSNIERFQITGTGADDSIITGDGDDIINGGAGNDALNSAGGNDRLTGVAQNAVNPGLGEIDTLNGGAGGDIYFLGNDRNAFYDDGSAATAGTSDYARIVGFNPAEDIIQLFGQKSSYVLGAVPIAGVSGTAIFIDKPGSEPDELIAIVEGVTGLNLTSNAFIDTAKFPGVFSFSQAAFSTPESSNASITVNRSQGSDGAASVTLTLGNGTASAPGDYDGASITVDFAAGETSKTVAIPIVEDSQVEGDETINLTLSNPTGGATLGTQTTATLTIQDNDFLAPGTLAFGASSFSIAEGDTNNRMVAINRTGGADGAISATINLTDGTARAPSDYRNTPITVSFANGEVSKTVTIPIVDDSTLEPDETLSLSLSNPTGGATIGQQSSATLTIINGDAPAITGFPNGLLGSNQGEVTLTIAGKNFTPADRFNLIDANGNARIANQVYWVSSNEVWATFDLVGLTPGRYDVGLENPQNGVATSVNDVFTVTNGAVGTVQTKLSYSAQGVATVTYTNVGQTDVAAPLFRISATNAQVDLGQTSSSAMLNQLLGLGLGANDSGAAGILTPGASNQFSFAFAPSGNGLISVAVEQVNPNELIDWAKIKAEYRADYDFIDAAAWDAIWSNFTASVGSTVGEFQAVMAENASYLSQLGQPTNDLNRLFEFEWKQAANTLTNVGLLSTTDAVDIAPGLSLTYNRTFYQSIAERYNLGALGRGWSSQWDVRATTDSQGNVVIRSVGDLQRRFEKQTNGTFLEVGGATLTIVNGEYRLKEASGVVSLFGSDGKLNYVEDTNGNRISLEYTNNLLTRLVHSNGDSLTLAYNAQGRIALITDSTGQATTYSYDASGESLLSVTTPQGVTTYNYDAGNVATTKYSLLSVASNLGYQRSFEYDSQGRLVKEFSNGQAQSLAYSYDSTGGVTITDSTGAFQTVLLDDRGNGGQIRGVENQNLLFRYDADGNLLNATLPNGGQTAYGYDANGNLTKQTNLQSRDVKFTYDATFNQLTGFTDPKGNVVSYGYDANNNPTQITYPDGSTQQFSVDAAGNITSTVNRRGNTIQYTYNPNGQLAQKQFEDGSSVVYSYDARGNLTSVVDATGTTAMQYDGANRLTNIRYPTGRSLQYTYNADGQRTQLVSQDGYTVNYSYDAVGRLKTLTDGTGQLIIRYDYDSAGRLIQETNGNGTYTTYEYDQQSQLTRISNYQANNTVNSRFEYAYDTLGRRTSMTTLEGTFEYGYDATGQLTSVVTPDKRTISYQYDAAGNRIAVTDNGVGTSYATNNLNQYTTVGNAVYTYDKDGNLVSKTEGGQTSTYTYDVENRLVQVVTPDGTWQYQYDGLGNRVATVFNGERTEYLLDPTGLGNVVGEYNGSGNLVANYTHGIGLVSQVNGGNRNFYDADAIGSTVGLTANDGSYINRYSYLPFGEDLTKVEGVANPFEYVGQFGVMDEGNGLDFMRARFYNSSLGQFTSVDPIGLSGGDTNLYRYVFNSPNNVIDPSGLSCISPEDIETLNTLEDIGYALGGGAAILTAFGTLASLGIGEVFVTATTFALPFALPGLIIGGISGALIIGSLYAQYTNSLCPPVTIEDELLDLFATLTPTGSKGEPHLVSFDGNSYDFQSVGEFTLVKSTTDDFEIQTRQEPYGNSTSASANSAVAIKIDDQRITFYANQSNPLLINGTAVDLPNGEAYAAGQTLITREGQSYKIITPNNDFIQVDNLGSFLNINLGLADNRQGNVIGLLGNNNNTQTDDFALRDGTIIGSTITDQQLYGDYANSWRITQATSLFDYVPGQDTNTFTDLTFPQTIITAATLTPAQRAAAEQIARDAGITDPNVLEDAILDIFITNADPQFIQGAIAQQRIATLSNPNTLINPNGFGTQHWLTAGAVIPYSIRFSNSAAAGTGTAPVAKVTITQTLDPDLDLNTFELEDIRFGTTTLDVPKGAQTFSQRIDLLATRGIYVDVIAGLDPATGIVTWTFSAIDPATGTPITDPTQGFLPPNDSNGSGQGTVGYSIQSNANSPTGSRIDAQATIIFDNQPVILTNAVFNSLDLDLPSSQVIPLKNSSSPDFTVSWSGSDTGSGIAAYDIYVSVNGGQYTPWQTNTTATSATYTGQPGNTYRFYSIAKDNIDNTEAAPSVADAEISIVNSFNNPPVAEANKTLTLTEDTVIALNIPAPTDPDGNPLSITVSTLPDPTKGEIRLANGTPVTLNQNLTLTDLTNLSFFPTANANGSAGTFSYSVSDGQGGIVSQVIDINITPDNNGGSWGDPHIFTFDQLHYDFQATGDFVLVRALDSDLEVQVRQVPWDKNPSTTINVGLATIVDGYRVTFFVDQPLPLVNNVSLAIEPGETKALGDGYISRTTISGYGMQGDQYAIAYPNGDQLINKVFSGFLLDPTLDLAKSRNVVGLLGNHNGNPNDDLALSDGTALVNPLDPDVLYGVFADSWRVGEGQSLFAASNSSPLLDWGQSTQIDETGEISIEGQQLILGSNGDDLLIGVNPQSAHPGQGEIDLLMGNKGSDTFILGDQTQRYYVGLRQQDYALITDLWAEDTIQLHGKASDYALGSSPAGLAQGTGIFLASDPNELIGIIQGDAISNVSLYTASTFQFV
jgi:RHS repeat-associated protein